MCSRAHTHTAQSVRERDEGGMEGRREWFCVCVRDGDRVCVFVREGGRHALIGAHRPDDNEGGHTTVY